MGPPLPKEDWAHGQESTRKHEHGGINDPYLSSHIVVHIVVEENCTRHVKTELPHDEPQLPHLPLN